MKLYYSSASPYVRKVLVTAWERDVYDKIEIIPAKAHPILRNAQLVAINSTGKVPCAITPSGAAVFDSRVITQYVDQLTTASGSVYSGPDRFSILTLEALSDSLLEACILCRYETVNRPKELYWEDWYNSQMDKVDSGLYDLEHKWLRYLDTPHFHAGAIAVACFLGYLDFRFAIKDWRTNHPKLTEWYTLIAKRPSMQRTLPHD